MNIGREIKRALLLTHFCSTATNTIADYFYSNNNGNTFYENAKLTTLWPVTKTAQTEIKTMTVEKE